MSERAYGYKYSDQQGKSTADIAKLMRADIKQAIADGLLPGAPVKYSVRIDTYAGGASIDIHVQNWAGAWEDCDGFAGHKPKVAGRGRDLCRNHFCAAKLAMCGETLPGAENHQKLSADAAAAQMTLERIHSAYNHDGSDSMVDHFDVNYYGQVSFETESAAAFRKREAEKLAARRAATDELAAQETRRVMIYGSKGKRTVHDAVEVDGRVRLVCGATLWRSTTLWSGEGYELTCTRCQKRAAAKPDAGVKVPRTFELRQGDGRLVELRMSLAASVADVAVAPLIRQLSPNATHYRRSGTDAFWLPL